MRIVPQRPFPVMASAFHLLREGIFPGLVAKEIFANESILRQDSAMPPSTEPSPSPEPGNRTLGRLLALFLLGGLACSACDNSAPVEDPTPAPEESPAEEPATPEDSSDAPESTSADSNAPEPEAAQEAIPDGPLLELKESEDGQTITVTGRLSSEYQIRDLQDHLKFAFPEATLEVDITHIPQLREVVWANRVNDLLIPLVKSVDGAYFHYEKGMTTLGGTVTERGLINQIEKMTSYIMEADDARGINNQIKPQ